MSRRKGGIPFSGNPTRPRTIWRSQESCQTGSGGMPLVEAARWSPTKLLSWPPRAPPGIELEVRCRTPPLLSKPGWKTHPLQWAGPVSAGVRASAVLDVRWILWKSGSLSASLAMAAPLSQPGTRTERPAGPGSTGPGREVKVEAEGRDVGWHLPLPAGLAASRSWSPGQRG